MKSKAAVVEQFRTHGIQEAALRVIAREGLDGTSMQAVAAEAGIAKGTIYLYFKSREDLIERTAASILTQLVRRLEPLLSLDARTPFAARLRGLIETKIAFFHEQRDFFRIYVAMSRPQRGARRGGSRTRKQYEQYLASLSSLLRRAMMRGEVRRADPDRLALLISEAVHAVIVRRLSETRSPAPAAEARWVADMFIHGLAAPEERR